MLGNGYFEAELGKMELKRQLELASRWRRRLDCRLGAPTYASRLGIWLGLHLIAAGEALCGRSRRAMMPMWHMGSGRDIVRGPAL